jgi:hypothetical protein
LYNKDSLMKAGLAELEGVKDGYIQSGIYKAIVGHDGRGSAGVLSGSAVPESLPGGARELQQHSLQGTGQAGNDGIAGRAAQLT